MAVVCDGEISFPQKSNEKIRHMIETGESNTCEIIKNGQHKLVKHLP